MNKELHQQLLEFVYGLLDEGEANALSERITSDPQVARAYATVKLQCDLVAKAARYDTPTVSWSRPDAGTPSNANAQTASKAWSENPYRRVANWCIGVAASGLICLVGSAYWMSSLSSHDESRPLVVAAATPVQVVLTGPSKLHSEASNPFTIQLENQAGTPVSTTFNWRVYDTNGVVSWEDSAPTDAWGVVRFDVEPAQAREASRLEITTANASPTPILRELEASPEQFVTYLRMDRPLFQPGERVSYRSVTLSRFGLRADREVTTSFEIVNADDGLIEGSTNVGETEHGVGSGTFDLPSDLPDGTYTLIASSPDNLFREEWRDFHVRRYEAPRLLKELELAQDSYTLGDQVDFDFSVKRLAGEPLAEVQLQIQATLDGASLPAPEAKTDADGNSRFSLSLPESIERGEASVSVTVQAGDDPAETISKDIPINLGKVNVDFFPEGGDLAAGLPSRVYFYARDPLGKPAHMEGRIVNSGDQAITRVVTGHEGRGVFPLTPVANEQYRLILEKPAGVTKEVPLPDTSADRFAVLETGAGVFAANAPITFTLYQRMPPKPLMVAAYCRGAMVAQQTIDTELYSVDQANAATFRGTLGLPKQAQGVIRLTVFDAATTPPEPIAERLIYRRVGQKLDVKFTPDAEAFAPGQAVQLDLAVRDENDAPVPAALGIAIVDDAVLNLADDKSMRMPTYFHLLTELDSPEQLEDANFYLADEPESASALDSLLGTQGWRRFRDLPVTWLAESQSGGLGGGGGFGGGAAGLPFFKNKLGSRYRSAAWAEVTAVPLSTATTIALATAVTPLSTASAAPTIIFASIVLLVLVGVASLRWTNSNRGLRVFAAAVAVVSLLVGVFGLSMKSIRVDQAADSATSALGREVANAASEGEAAVAADRVTASLEAPTAEQGKSFMYKADDAGISSDAPVAAAATEPELSAQLQMEPKGAARFVVPEGQRGLGADAAISEKAEIMSPSKDKKVADPSPAAQPPSQVGASPSAPQPKVDELAGRAVMLADASKSIADSDEERLLTREYAEWFYRTRPNVSPSAQDSSTIFWVPLFLADESGKATVYFNLPQRPSSFRAIVEAHGADRLGSGQLLINSQ